MRGLFGDHWNALGGPGTTQNTKHQPKHNHKPLPPAAQGNKGGARLGLKAAVLDVHEVFLYLCTTSLGFKNLQCRDLGFKV